MLAHLNTTLGFGQIKAVQSFLFTFLICLTSTHPLDPHSEVISRKPFQSSQIQANYTCHGAFILSHSTLPYPTLPYPALPYPTLPYHALFYPSLTYPILAYPTLAYPTLS